jgi:hypothetical protein
MFWTVQLLNLQCGAMFRVVSPPGSGWMTTEKNARFEKRTEKIGPKIFQAANGHFPPFIFVGIQWVISSLVVAASCNIFFYKNLLPKVLLDGKGSRINDAAVLAS